MKTRGILASLLLFGMLGCERVPEWERRSVQTKSVELGARLTEFRKWLFSCRISADAKADAVWAEKNLPQADLEEFRQYFSQRNLSSIDVGAAGISLGTGFLWDAFGHLILSLPQGQAPSQIECRRGEGEWLEAELKATDPSIELGLYRLKTFSSQQKGNPWLQRSADLKQDEAVFAVASPLVGVVERVPLSVQALGAPWHSVMDQDLATFWPPLGPLFTGGVVVDEKFYVVGFLLPVWKGQTFAVQLARLQEVVRSLIEGKPIKRPFTGLRLSPRPEGLFVQQVEVGSPAYRAGLRPQDQILEWNHRSLRHLSDWRELTASDIGASIAIRYARGESHFETSLKVATED